MAKKPKEGRVIVYDIPNGDELIVGRMTCETDFLARDKTFSDTLIKICRIIGDEEEGDVNSILDEFSKETGEKIGFINTFWMKSTELLPSNYYLHHDNKKAAFVQFRAEGYQEEAEKLAYDLAMHVVALNPDYSSVNSPGFSWDDVDLEISEELLNNKPPAIIEKIKSGKKAKYRQEHILLDQPFIKTPDRTVADEIAEFNATYPANVELLGTFRVEL